MIWRYTHMTDDNERFIIDVDWGAGIYRVIESHEKSCHFYNVGMGWLNLKSWHVTEQSLDWDRRPFGFIEYNSKCKQIN